MKVPQSPTDRISVSSRCPICGKPAVADYRPFCSRRCADVDLAHWLRGDYRISGEPVSPETDPAGEGQPD